MSAAYPRPARLGSAAAPRLRVGFLTAARRREPLGFRLVANVGVKPDGEGASGVQRTRCAQT